MTTVMFHSTVGPAGTTVTDICREAGVQRATFYRHFPDELYLFKECRALSMSENPLPDPGACATIDERPGPDRDEDEGPRALPPQRRQRRHESRQPRSGEQRRQPAPRVDPRGHAALPRD